ncbi:hypothetical protein NFI96_005287 [Prochilodus magdalenae]|nr:hypothetical protein NFI96_005287 [Prochilodus magdalenae]
MDYSLDLYTYRVSCMHDGKPYCHKPCYAALYGPKGVNIGGAGSYVYETPVSDAPVSSGTEPEPKAEEKKAAPPTRGPVKAASFSSFSGQPNICPRCSKTVYFAEKVTSLGKDWHRPCLRCERCSKTLAPGSHAEHDGQPYCHKPCYAVLFGPKEPTGGRSDTTMPGPPPQHGWRDGGLFCFASCQDLKLLLKATCQTSSDALKNGAGKQRSIRAHFHQHGLTRCSGRIHREGWRESP